MYWHGFKDSKDSKKEECWNCRILRKKIEKIKLLEKSLQFISIHKHSFCFFQILKNTKQDKNPDGSTINLAIYHD